MYFSIGRRAIGRYEGGNRCGRSETQKSARNRRNEREALSKDSAGSSTGEERMERGRKREREEKREKENSRFNVPTALKPTTKIRRRSTGRISGR